MCCAHLVNCLLPYRNHKKEFFKDLLLLVNVKSVHNHDSGIYHSLEGVR